MNDELSSALPGPFQLAAASRLGLGIPDGLAAVARLIEDAKGHDLSLYRPRLVLRRLRRRARECHMGHLAEYIGFLRDDPSELDVVFPRLLGRASRFFQGPSQLAALRSMVLEPLCRRPAGEPIRAWIAGCSTGEEAYSIAMLLLEVMASLQVTHPIRIFASGVDSDGIEGARRAIYRPDLLRAVSEERRRSFFVREGAAFRVHEDLRERVEFSLLDPALGPPSAELDFIVCRNMLGTLRPASRREFLSRAHAALRPGGCLLLGAADARPALAQFDALDARNRLFVRVAPDSRPLALAQAAVSAEDQRAAETILVRSRELVSSVSHEFRTPLHAILGYSDILGEEISASLSAEHAGFLRGIRRSAGELLELVNTMLEIGRFDHAETSHHLERIRISSFVEGIVEEIEAGAGRAGPRILSRFAADLPVLLSDPLKLKLALKNLIGNAVKYGRLDVQVSVGSSDGGLEFWVTDRGPGISVEDQSHIFGAFRQGESAGRGDIEGAGLGLYFTRKVIESLGGTVGVESRPGFGSIFRVWLPRGAESSCEPRPIRDRA